MAEKKYIIDNPDLMAEWDWKKNDELGLNPSTITSGSNKKVWWTCKNHHSWQDTVGNRTNNRNCPYCSGHRVWVGFNDLATTHGALCEEWDYDKNDGHLPTEFSQGSSFLAAWICPEGHSYKATIANRTGLNRGCPFCAGRYVIKGKTDLLTLNPKLAEEWDYEKNDIHPSEITANNPRKVWWKGKCGHSWQASVNSRNRGNSCPICAHITIDNTTCLATVNPELARRWHPNKNGTLTPHDVFPYSTKKVWWVCEKGHEFMSTVANQNSSFSCSQCSKELKTSFPEQAIYFYISQQYADAMNRYLQDGYELDIYIPSLQLGIEYDGLLYHTSKTKEKERIKDDYYANRGIRIIRVKETYEQSFTDSTTIIWHRVSPTYQFLDDAIKRLFSALNVKQIVIDIKRDSAKISASYLSLERKNSIATKHPRLLAEWDYEKNGFLNPQYIGEKSTKPIWWICESKHSFLMTPAKRTVRNQNCPYCAGRYATPENNLLVKNPSILTEWNYERNEGLSPADFTPVSGKKVWWKCSRCGHEYLTTIASRTHNGHGCPECAKSARLNSFNTTILSKNGSFGEKHPELLKEWDYNKNTIEPFAVPEFSKLKVWWICSVCGNEWEATIQNRAHSRNCPACAKKSRALHRRKPVLQYSIEGIFIRKYDSVRDAGKEFGVDGSSITMCCRGKTKTAYGYIWKYDV